MGCDIHMYTELKREKSDEKKNWYNVDNWRYNPYFVEGEDDGERKMNCQHIYSDRNYELFTILAGVRDYDMGNKPIDQPRGLPKDVSDITKAEYDRWDNDGHSHSYFTLRELKEHLNSLPKMKYSGLITPAAAKALDEGEVPTTWCQGASPELGLVWREWEDYDLSLKKIVEALEERYRDEKWIFDDKKELTKKQMEEIRIVFWFDN